MSELGIHETAINRTQDLRVYDIVTRVSDIYVDISNLASLYRYGLEEHGRCAGKVYVDTADGAKHIGYVFLKRETYHDCNETYLRETWVSMGEYHPATPERITH